MEKTCRKCGKIKLAEEFYIHLQMSDGRLNICKDCVKQRVKERERRLSKDPDWLIKERTRGRDKYHRLYKGFGANGTTEAKKAWAKRNRLKIAAGRMAIRALGVGRLIKKPCEVCGDEKVEMHHDDYYKPIDVRWLCIKHHNEHHVILREKELRERKEVV